MGSDIFTAIKGLASPTLENAVFPQDRTSSTNEQVRRASAARLEQQNRNAEHALAFFKGKRLLGGNLLLGGGTPVNPLVTRSLFAELQKSEDDAFALILRQAQERVQKNQFLPSAFNPVSSEERVQRLLENAPQSRERQRYRYSNYDPVADRQRLEELQARIDAILQASRSRLARALQEGALPDVSQRPRIADLLPPYLSEAKLDDSINLRLSRRLAHVDLDPGTDTNLVLDALLRIRRPNSFVGLTTTQIEEKQKELGLTDEQLAAEQKRDTEGIPTHVQVTLHGRSLNLDPGFVEAQRRIDPNFQIESHKSPTGSLVLDGSTLSSRNIRGALLRHTLTYEEYQRLEYEPPATDPTEEQIDYFSVIAFRHPDGSRTVLDDKGSARSRSNDRLDDIRNASRRNPRYAKRRSIRPLRPFVSHRKRPSFQRGGTHLRRYGLYQQPCPQHFESHRKRRYNYQSHPERLQQKLQQRPRANAGSVIFFALYH